MRSAQALTDHKYYLSIGDRTELVSTVQIAHAHYCLASSRSKNCSAKSNFPLCETAFCHIKFSSVQCSYALTIPL